MSNINQKKMVKIALKDQILFIVLHDTDSKISSRMRILDSQGFGFF